MTSTMRTTRSSSNENAVPNQQKAKGFDSIKPFLGGLKRTTLSDISNTMGGGTNREMAKKKAGGLDVNKARTFGTNLQAAAPPASAREAMTGRTDLVTNAVRGNQTQRDVAKDPMRQFRTFPSEMKSVEGLVDLVIDDIDAKDVNDPQHVTDYVNDIYALHRDREVKATKLSGYMEKTQVDVNQKMRAILIDWLIEVHLKFRLVPETMALTVSIIDRYLATKAVPRQKLQLVGCTAMLLASKYEEIYAPEIRDFVYISDKACSKDDILKMERHMLSTLNYSFKDPNALTFLPRILKAAGADRKTSLLASYFVELTYQDYKMMKYLPSHIASAAVYLANKASHKVPWNSAMQRATKLQESAISPCITDITGCIKGAKGGNLEAVYKKYSNAKFSEVAKTTGLDHL